MSRKRLAFILFVPTLIVVLAIGLTRGKDTNDPDAVSPTTGLPGEGGALASGRDAELRPTDETIDVPEGSDCKAATDDDTPACVGYQVLDAEVAWMVEQDGEEQPIASFLRRESPTSWRRVLVADGSFDLVNVRIDDITADGGVEAIYGFHNGDDLVVDVVDYTGTVLLHLDLGPGHILVGGGVLIAWTRDGDQWKREEIRVVDGKSEVVATEVVDGPAEGNL